MFKKTVQGGLSERKYYQSLDEMFPFVVSFIYRSTEYGVREDSTYDEAAYELRCDCC